jgi:4-hydroxy-tetrahydrodipicolinate synthase
MKRFPKLKGIFPPLLTPMFDNGALDMEGYRKMTNIILESNDVNGLFVMGATGEYPHLSSDEKIEILKVFSSIDKKGKVIAANVTGKDAQETTAMMKLAADCGIDIAFVISSFLTDSNVEDACGEIEKAGIPFMVYFSPFLKDEGCDIIKLVGELMKHPSFVGLKDSFGDMEDFSSLCALYGDEISVFEGIEMLFLPALACGADGIIGGGLNFNPGIFTEIKNKFDMRDCSAAVKLQHKAIMNWRSVENKAILLCKKIWKEKGIINGAFSRYYKDSSVLDEELAAAKKMFKYNI